MPNNLKLRDGQQVLRSVYDVDKNCLRVCLVDGGAGEGPGVEVIIDHTSDSIRLGDGTTLTTVTTVSGKNGLDVNIITQDLDIRDLDASIDNVAIQDSDGDELAINPDGSINFTPTLNTSITSLNKYGDVAAVASSTETTVVSHTASVGKITYLQYVSVSGENIAVFKVKVNGTVVDLKRTYFGGPFNEDFKFDGDSSNGVKVSVGDVIIVTVEHFRPFSGDFNAKILYLEI